MLTVEQVNDIIKDNETVVLKVWRDGCPFCVEYDPIFNDVSTKHSDKTFASYKAQSPDDELLKKYELKSLPATLIFKKGEFAYKHLGRLFADELENFLRTGQSRTIEQWAVLASLAQLEGALNQHQKNYDEVSHALGVIKAECNRRKAKLEELTQGCKNKTLREAVKSFFTLDGWKNPCCFCRKVRKVVLSISIVAITAYLWYR